MLHRASTKAKWPRAIPVVLLTFVIVSASAACAAMAPAPVAPSHPCCPRSGPAEPDHCAQTVCISNVPAVRAALPDSGMGVPAVIRTEGIPVSVIAAPRRVRETAFCCSAGPDLFVKNHSLLI